MTKVFNEATVLATEEFLEKNKDFLDPSIADRLQWALERFQEREKSVDWTNDKAMQVLRGQGVTLNAMVLWVMLLSNLSQDQENELPIQIRDLSDEAIELSRKLRVGHNVTWQGHTVKEKRGEVNSS